MEIPLSNIWTQKNECKTVRHVEGMGEETFLLVLSSSGEKLNYVQKTETIDTNCPHLVQLEIIGFKENLLPLIYP